MRGAPYRVASRAEAAKAPGTPRKKAAVAGPQGGATVRRARKAERVALEPDALERYLGLLTASLAADKGENIAQARRLVTAAVRHDRPDLVILPEMWSCLGGSRDVKLAAAERLPTPGGAGDGAGAGGEAYVALQGLAREAGVLLHGGSIGERVGERISNTSLVFGPDGRELARYRKIHLFDVVTPGGETYRESELFVPGDAVVTVGVGAIRVGLALCYDLRVPELFLQLRRAGAEVVTLPAAFTSETGQAHWETLLRARAIETQCWVAASATCGQHSDGQGSPRITFGNSMLVDPWGTVVARASTGVGWATGTLDRAYAGRVRAGMPVLDHRRLS